jgi:hypothetical protein
MLYADAAVVTVESRRGGGPYIETSEGSAKVWFDM